MADGRVYCRQPSVLGREALIERFRRRLCFCLKIFSDRLPDFSDLVCFWFEKAKRAIQAVPGTRVGLVATNSIRGGSNRFILDAITRELSIFEAWSDEPWVVEGAAVRVSIVCFSHASETARLNGESVMKIHPDLTADVANLTIAKRLIENRNRAFIGIQPTGPFQVPGDLARSWLAGPLNPNGRPNSDVLAPFLNGMDLTRRDQGRWIVDFGIWMDNKDAALFERPFEYLREHVYPVRQRNNQARAREEWWI